MEFFEFVEDGGIGTLTINREKVLNALNEALILEGIEFVKSLYKKDLRALVITGKGAKSFVAGADIAELKEASVEEAREIGTLGKTFFDLIENLPCPVLAAINGFALGGGLELALSCDMRYASENAKLGLPEVGLGLIPGYGGTQRLIRAIGEGKAKEYIYTGKMVNAQEAYETGIVNSVFPQENLMEEVLKIAKQIAKNGPLAVRAAKRAVNTGRNMDLFSAQQVENMEFAGIFGTEDKNEGTTAFVEKRKPEFQGK